MQTLTFEQWMNNEEYLTNVNPNISIHNGSRRTLAHACGKMAARTVKFFKKSETKTSFLVSYWATETVVTLTVIVAFAATNPVITSLLGLLWLYGSYSLFGALEALVKN